MKAIAISERGKDATLLLVERPIPTLQEGEVLIKVQAAGINRPDILQRKGVYPPPPGASDLPGLEVAGEIVAGDVQNSPFQLGDRVCALVSGGGYAQYCAAPLSLCLPIPPHLSAVEAASLPETFFTVWSNVFDRGQLKPNETLLVQGGSSGIGVAAIQIAKALGHTVFVTAGSEKKCRACESLGALRAIHYPTEDFVEIIQSHTEGAGVDVILDMVGGSYIHRELLCLKEEGRLLLIALLGGASATLDMRLVLQRRLTITGSTLRSRSVGFKAAIAEKIYQTIWPLLISGKIKPVIDQTFSLKDAQHAHQRMESGQHIGKIVLVVDEGV